MGSDQEHQQPNISNESFLKGETVNPSSPREVPSSRRAPRRQPPNEAISFGYPFEPPYTERYVRWCGGTGVSRPLLPGEGDNPG